MGSQSVIIRAGSSAVRTPALHALAVAPPSQPNWPDYKRWLDEQFSVAHATSMFSLSAKYTDMLHDASKLLTLPQSRRPYIMRALSNLAKFTGQYEEWRQALRANRISWGGRKAADVFRAILEEEGCEEKGDDWLMNVISKLPNQYRFVLIFQRLTGLRIEEACKAVTLLAQGKIEEYYDPELMIIRHFKYPKLFLRRSKNAFISFVSPALLEAAMRYGMPASIDGLHSAMVRGGLKERTTMLRKAFATQLRQAGIPRESIDLIQGRIPASVFSQHYYRPGLKALGEQVQKTLELSEEKLFRLLN